MKKLKTSIKILFKYIYYIIFLYKIRLSISKENINEIKAFKLEEWRHQGVFYFTGVLNNKKIFIKCMKNKNIIYNEWIAYQQLKKSSKFEKKYFIEYLFYKNFNNFGIIASNYIDGISLEKIKINTITGKKTVIFQLEKILSILEDSKIIHRDINPKNIYFKNGKLNKLKLIDFSYSISNELTTKLKEQIFNQKILKSLNKNYSPKGLVWDDYYSVDKIIKEKLKTCSKKITLKKGSLIYEYKK